MNDTGRIVGGTRGGARGAGAGRRGPARPAVWIVLAGLAACSGGGLADPLSEHQRRADSWVGAPVGELRAAWGDWDGARSLRAGMRQVVYSRARSLAGMEIGCEARFTVSGSGTITRAEVSGSIGGCRELLGGAPVRGPS